MNLLKMFLFHVVLYCVLLTFRFFLSVPTLTWTLSARGERFKLMFDAGKFES